MPRLPSPFLARIPTLLRFRRPERGLADLDAATLRDLGLCPDQVQDRNRAATSAARVAVSMGGLPVF